MKLSRRGFLRGARSVLLGAVGTAVGIKALTAQRAAPQGNFVANPPGTMLYRQGAYMTATELRERQKEAAEQLTRTVDAYIFGALPGPSHFV